MLNLADADAIAFLPGWVRSSGCRIEFSISNEYKIESIMGWEMDEILKEYKQHLLRKGEVINTAECYPKIKLN